MLTALASLGVALVAVGIAVAAWLRPVPESHPAQVSEPTYTDQQIADARAHVCEAYSLVDHAVVTNTHRSSPTPGDETSSLATAANARLALYAGGDYLLSRLESAPAAPTDLASPVRSLAYLYKEFGIRALNNEPNADLDQLRLGIDANSATIERQCK